MDSARWVRVQELFHETADLPVEARGAFLATACGGDEALIREVQALLDGDAAASPILDSGVAHVADAILPPALGAAIPPQAFGPYRLTQLLGEGGMGVVYLARRDDLDSVAAVKILRDAWLSPARRERFVVEQRTLAALNHPSIAHLFDAGTLPDGTPWIAMEYVDGVALGEYCRREALSLRARLRLVRAVCEAVQHAHQHLVIHRDLKPSNILVRPDGAVKLLDFGIAKQLERAGTDADATRTGLRLMTPAYAAPEQILGERVGIQADVYSLGVILYELLSGVLPFELSDRTPGQAERMILEGEPTRPSARRTAGGVAASRAEWNDLDVLCLTAMHRDPTRRYPSVDALIRDLDRFLAGAALDARGDSVRYRVATFARRHRRALSTAGVVMVAGAALVTFYTMRLAQARDRAVAESVRAQRIQRFVTTLFQGGDEAAGPADSLRVVTLLDRGVAEARTLDQEPAVQAELYVTLGGIHRQLGQFDRADSLLAHGVALWRRVAGERSMEHARALVALGDLRTDQARHEEAESIIREGVATLQRTVGGGDASLAEARIVLGRALSEGGDYHLAIAALDSVVAVLDDQGPTRSSGAANPTGDGSTLLLDALGELASAHFYAGAYDVADSLNRRVLGMSRRLFGDRHPRVADDLMNLGATEQERGNYGESERYFREALERSIAFHGEDHARTAGNLVYLGRSLLLQQRHEEAREAFNRSLAVRERVFGPTHPSVANVLNELGSLAIREERYDSAEVALLRVREIYRTTYPGLNYRTGVATGNLADTYLYRRDFRRAESLYREALAHYVASQGPEHLNTGIGHIKLGRSMLRSGRLREAIVETERGYAIVGKVARADVSFLQAARLDLSIAYDSLGQGDRARVYREERERYLPKP